MLQLEPMTITPIKTRPFLPPQDDLFAIFKSSVSQISEQTVVVITSKVVAIHQGRCIPVQQANKDDLVYQEADWYLERSASEWDFMLTVKHNTLIASAGIDQSNAQDHWVLLPSEPDKAAQTIWQWLKETYQLVEVGVLIVDSHVQPMRRGTVGISIGSYGFNPVYDYRGKPDIFGRPLKVTTSNRADGLAAAAVLTMGEGQECTPIALITDAPKLEFGAAYKKTDKWGLKIEFEEDLYAPVLRQAPWHEGKGGQ